MTPPGTDVQIAKRLRSAGKRLTPERSLLLRIITANPHLDAAAIHRIARSKKPRIGLATVYRTLRLLKELGIVRASEFGEDHFHYEVRHEDHIHLICRRCGVVVEVPCPSGLRELGARNGFEVHQTRFELIGYCRKCRKRTVHRASKTRRSSSGSAGAR
jgi:Fe2+ or Zn2+ uptake regulation protein